jgi:electron transfer flavoprotein alpha subunit
VIIAINKYSEAPIMSFCDLAVVGDATQVVPALTELLGGAKSATRT